MVGGQLISTKVPIGAFPPLLNLARDLLDIAQSNVKAMILWSCLACRLTRPCGLREEGMESTLPSSRPHRME